MVESAQPLESSRSAEPHGHEKDLVELLGRRVESLVERFRDARRGTETLEARVRQLERRLLEREQRIGELEEGARDTTRMRQSLAQRIEGLVAIVERLERGE